MIINGKRTVLVYEGDKNAQLSPGGQADAPPRRKAVVILREESTTNRSSSHSDSCQLPHLHEKIMLSGSHC